MTSTISLLLAFLLLALSLPTAYGGPISWGICQTSCNGGYVLCCASAGAVAGTFSLGLGVPAALATCSAIQGTCMALCTPLLIAPTP
ncbi:hypothetical protein BDY24DRAFT_342943 [Mrakia frigida]|uniref:uncharacterized protein n=1 Tax=Mrakia frigida TaxID=29902 RepID=UPI003FCC0496